MFAKMDFKFPPAVMISGFECGEGGKRQVVKAGLTTEPEGGIPISVLEVVRG